MHRSPFHLFAVVALLSGCTAAGSSGAAPPSSGVAQKTTVTSTTPPRTEPPLMFDARGQAIACGTPERAFIGLTDPSDAIAVTLELQQSSPAVDRVVIQLPDERIEAQIEIGTDVGDPYCNDLVGADYRIDQRLAVTGGRLQIAFEDQIVTVTIEDLTVESDPISDRPGLVVAQTIEGQARLSVGGG